MQEESKKKREKYTKTELLGEGSFGKAYLVNCENSGNQAVIKEIDISRMSDNEKREALKEAKIMESLKHPNIIKFHEVYKTKKGNLCIVMDYADGVIYLLIRIGGDLAQRITKAKGKHFPEAQILDWLTQIALGLKHCHERRILHRDLKSKNVFLTAKNFVKLGDFGIARVLSNTMDKANTIVGTPYYLSPEIIEDKGYRFESDIWSLGVILYEMCALKLPFDGKNITTLARKIIAGSYSPIPPQYSKDLKLLIAYMLSIDPMKRPSIHKLLRYPFIQSRIQTFMSQTRYNMKFTDSINKKVRMQENEHNKVQVYWDKVRAHEKPKVNAHEQVKEEVKVKPIQKKEVEKKAPKASSKESVSKESVTKEQGAPVKHSEAKHCKKWEEDSKKLRAEMEKSRLKNKGAKHEVDICLVERNPPAANETETSSKSTIEETIVKVQKQEPMTKHNPSVKKHSSNVEKSVHVDKEPTGGIRKEIMKKKQQTKGCKSAFENFSEEDVLVNKAQMKQQIEEVTKSIAKNLKPQLKEEQYQEDSKNIMTELETVSSH